MMNNNKILTVSYGTFSCTLEGFDDSFGTMKAIAEYFRDLAAEDRYFGAEPSQPDAQMLAHIAQKEVSRPVAARRQDGQIVLSAQEATDTDGSQQSEPNTADAPALANEAPAIQPETLHAEVPQEPIDLSKIDIVPGQPDEEIKAFFDEKAAQSAATDDMSEDAATAPVNSSIAAKLQRIRSVVSRQDVETDEADYTEDEHAEEKPAQVADTQDFVAEAVKDIETALDADDAAETAQADNEEDDVSALLSRLDAQTDDTAQPEESIVAKDDGTLDDDADGENLFGAETPIKDILSPEAAAAPRGRVIKVKRADLEKAIEKGDLEEYYGDDEVVSQADADKSAPEATQTDIAETDMPASSLSKDQEDELARELAEVEAGFADAPTDDEPRRTLPSLGADTGSDMNRLLAETDNQMDDPEGAVRRDAIAHLRAAVAAKKADMALGAAEKAAEGDDAYRNDLAEVVKPRRPVSTAEKTERPAEPRPAPLKLVAEQRIDQDVSAPKTPVQPRRVAAIAATEEPTKTAALGFAEFAGEMGAKSLPELLEAAAAYMSFVEGLDQFSRPQLMNTVRQVEQEDFSREEGLRSFGQLLRSGKLQKLDGGRFKVSDNIGYQPEERAAG